MTPPQLDVPLLLSQQAVVVPIAAEQILDALDGKPVPRIVNPQVWPDYAKRFEKTFGFAPQR